MQYMIWTALFFLVTISVFSIITKIMSWLVPALNFYPLYGQLLKQAHKIWADRDYANSSLDEPLFQGSQTVKMARLVFNIIDAANIE